MQSSLSSKFTQNQITLHNFYFYHLLPSLSHGLLQECFTSVPISAFLSLLYLLQCVPGIPRENCPQTCLLGPNWSGPSSVSPVSSTSHSSLGVRPSCCLSPTSHMLLPQGIGNRCSFLEFSSPNICLSFLSRPSSLCWSIIFFLRPCETNMFKI